MNVFEGKLMASSLRVAIVVGRFNEFIGSKLLEGAKEWQMYPLRQEFQ